MRVAVHYPERTEGDGTVVPPSAAAFRLGRVEDFTHPITGETTPRDQVITDLVAQAEAENPGLEVKVEELQDNGDGTSTWVPAGAASPTTPGGQTVQAPEQTAAQTQAAGGAT